MIQIYRFRAKFEIVKGGNKLNLISIKSFWKNGFEKDCDKDKLLVAAKDDINQLLNGIERLEKEKEILIKEVKRLHGERYKQPSVVAELLKLRAYIFTCSYKTAWEKWLEDDEKFDFTFEEIKEYIELTNS